MDIEEIVLFGFIALIAVVVVIGLAVSAREVDGCEYTGEAVPVGTKYGAETAYHYRCDGVDVYSSRRPRAVKP
jgi:hypothetical protein